VPDNAQTSKLLFLDFDGVMHPFGAAIDFYFCRRGLLEAWLRARPGVDLVISSSWREMHPLDEMRSYFSEDLQSRIVGVTPEVGFCRRDHEILQWLAIHGRGNQVWAALDDQAELFPTESDRVILCDGEIGLRDRDLAKLDDILELRHWPLGIAPADLVLGSDVEAKIQAMIDEKSAAEKGNQERIEARRRARADEPKPPILFLDIDNVLCLGRPYTGDDAYAVIQGQREDGDSVFASLFVPEACVLIRSLYQRAGGSIRTVISSNWRRNFTPEQMWEIFERAGLACVADSIFEDERWRTPQASFTPDRWLDIETWLGWYSRGEPWAVVDDHISGGALRAIASDPTLRLQNRVVLCTPGLGLQQGDVDQLLVALQTPLNADKPLREPIGRSAPPPKAGWFR
jgi:hypothetical protein